MNDETPATNEQPAAAAPVSSGAPTAATEPPQVDETPATVDAPAAPTETVAPAARVLVEETVIGASDAYRLASEAAQISTDPQGTPAEPDGALVDAPSADAPAPDFHLAVLKVPHRPTNGYAPTSFGANLTGKAAKALADLTAGYAAVSGNANIDANHALTSLLEALADAIA